MLPVSSPFCSEYGKFPERGPGVENVRRDQEVCQREKTMPRPVTIIIAGNKLKCPCTISPQ